MASAGVQPRHSAPPSPHYHFASCPRHSSRYSISTHLLTVCARTSLRLSFFDTKTQYLPILCCSYLGVFHSHCPFHSSLELAVSKPPIPVLQPLQKHHIERTVANSASSQTPYSAGRIPCGEDYGVAMPRHDLSLNEQLQQWAERLWAWVSGPGGKRATVLALRLGDRIRRNLAPRRLFSFPHLLVACWMTILLWGERWVFDAKVESCDWDHWENWVRVSRSHRIWLPRTVRDS